MNRDREQRIAKEHRKERVGTRTKGKEGKKKERMEIRHGKEKRKGSKRRKTDQYRREQ